MCHRYQNISIKDIEAGEFGDAEDIACKEDPVYERSFEANRQRALAAVASYAGGKDMEEAALLLFQVCSATSPCPALLLSRDFPCPWSPVHRLRFRV